MTDEKIEKALSLCGHRPKCSKCPYLNEGCSSALPKDSLDYINRLKAEKEQLKNRLQISPFGDDKIDELEAALSYLRDEKDQIRKETAKEILQLLANDGAICEQDLEWLCNKYGVEVKVANE